MRVIKISDPASSSSTSIFRLELYYNQEGLPFTACKMYQRLIPKHHYSMLCKTQI